MNLTKKYHRNSYNCHIFAPVKMCNNLILKPNEEELDLKTLSAYSPYVCYI